MYNETFVPIEELAEEKKYWLEKLSGELSELRLITDFSRTNQNKRKNYKMYFDEVCVDHLRRISKNNDLSLFVLLLASFKVFLFNWTGQNEIVISSPILGTDTRNFNRLVFFRDFIYPGMVFKEVLMEVKQTVADGYRNQYYPLSRLIASLDKGNKINLNRVILQYENIHGQETVNAAGDGFENDIMLIIRDIDGKLEAEIIYNSGIFKVETIHGFLSCYIFLLNQVLSDISININKIEPATGEEKQKILYVFNQPDALYSGSQTISHLLEEQAVRTPDNIALVGPSLTADHESPISMTYRETAVISGQLATCLREKGVQADTIVAIEAERSLEMIIGMLGIVKSGGAYLPIDPDYPEERKKYMLADSATRVIVTTGVCAKKTESYRTLEDGTAYETVLLDTPAFLKYSPSHHHTFLSTQPYHLAYLIYTSGTTGKPKGVLVENRNVVNTVNWFVTVHKVDSRTRILQLSDYTFDASVNQVFGSLISGAGLYIATKEVRADIEKMRDYIIYQSINIINFVPSYLKELLCNIDKLESLHTVLSGAEKLGETTKDTLIKKGYRLVNQYGPTETTIDALALECSTERISLGKPISNVNAYILDKYNHIVPPGVVGELYIAGAGVARGYLNQPEFTAERFLCNNKGILIPGSSKNIYKTGDLARWLQDGNVEFLGRIDHQVKIRGYRVELGEIENRLLKQKEIKEAAVLSRGDENNTYLCGYIVSEREFERGELQAALSKELPVYMIPSYFVHLDKLPRTANGKLDTNALPHPEIKEECIAPRNEIEKKLAIIWGAVLGMKADKIGSDSNFFELGGHSLSANIVAAKIHQEFNVKDFLTQIFEVPILKELAERIKNAAKDDYISIRTVEDKDYYELSSAQKRLYVLQQIDPASTVYNIPFLIALEGKVEKKLLANAFRELIGRYESFRTSFRIINGEPVQRIQREADFTLKYHDFHGTHSVSSSDDIIKNYLNRPFDLSRAPLLRVGLIRETEDKFLLIIALHHIITDGVSMNIMVENFMGLIKGEALPRLRIQYKDFSQWQNEEKKRRNFSSQEEYWLKEFEGEIPVLNLPTDYPRPAAQNFEGSSITFEADPGDFRVLKKYCQEEEVTLFMLLMAVTNLLLSKISGQEDIIVGTPIAGRGHADLEDIIGMFVNTLALRNYPYWHTGFRDFLSAVKQRTIKAFENQDYQFEDLVEKVVVGRDASRNPLFDAMFVMQNAPMQPLEIPGLKLSPCQFENKTSKFDLTLSAMEVDDKLLFMFEFSIRIFKRETIEKYIDYFRKIIGGIVENKDRRIADLEIISEEDKKRIVYDFNKTSGDYPKNKSIQRLFEEQVEKAPDHIAVVSVSPKSITGTAAELTRSNSTEEKTHMTYGKLNTHSNQLARFLESKTIGADTAVAIMSDPCPEMLVGILAVLKCGAFYVPIDPSTPRGRVSSLLADSEAKLFLTSQPYSMDAAVHAETLNLKDEGLYKGYPGNTERPDSSFAPVYMIYTSGTTGNPKGVLVKHESLVNYAWWFIGEARLTVEDKTVLTSSFAYDLGYTSIYSSLLSGAQLHLLTKELYLPPACLLAHIHREEITYLKMTPSFFSAIAESPHFYGATCHRLRLLVLGGEAINPLEVEKAYEAYKHLKIMNHYGPTETTIGSISRLIDREDLGGFLNRPSIGKPIANTSAYILDKYMNVLPVGLTGELYIGGMGVAKGYFKREALTKEKFVVIEKIGNERIYRTGDLARWLRDGNIEFIGRIDNQVKIRGYRIELSEIENRLLDHKDIIASVVTLGSNTDGNKYICAYIVPRNHGTPAETESMTKELKTYLSFSLPEYMVPTYFIYLKRLPLTANGKLDRKALPPAVGTGKENITPPGNAIEEKLAEIWSEVLGIAKDTFGIHENFFELGGHSLSATRLASRIYREFDVEIPLVEIFKVSTIQSLSQFIGSARPMLETLAERDSNLLLLRPGIKKDRQLFLIHDGTGEVEGYIEFCKHLTNQFYIWGIRSNRLEAPSPRNITIPELAEAYIKTIKKVQRQGPYHIAGWSLGGTIAFEIAAQLERMNEEIRFLSLIDSPPPQRSVWQDAIEFSLESELNFIKEYIIKGEMEGKLRNVSGLNQFWLSVVDYLDSGHYDIEMIKNVIAGYGMHLLPNFHQLDIKESVYYMNMGRTLRNARALYTPSGTISCPVCYFAAAQSKSFNKEHWERYTPAGITYNEIEGDHFSIFRMPIAADFAKKFEKELLNRIDFSSAR